MATEAILDPKLPRPHFDDTLRYGVKKTDDGWLVIIHRIQIEKNGQLSYLMDGTTGVQLDRNFKVTFISGRP